jgi:AP-3 complex subunit mu
VPAYCNIRVTLKSGRSNPILEQVYSSRPPSAESIITRLIALHTPRPPILHLSDVNPPSTIFSIVQSNLLLLCPCSQEVDSFAVLEFLHRVVDVLEDFLGAPLLGSKIENNYDIVAQLMGEMCDGGIVCNTEGNSLRESVEVASKLERLFDKVGIPGTAPGISSSSNNLAATLKANANLNSGPAIPWRRPNVRHTSNELYVDILENISVILAPSGRPISAIAAGSIQFTAKISGVPELLLNLVAPGGTSGAKAFGITNTMQLPTFHPCVRLAAWNKSPGTLSFIPPDGKFMLAGYEVDLLPSPLDRDQPPSSSEKLFLPASIQLKTCLGPSGCDFEARLTLNNNFPGAPVAKQGPRSTGSTAFSFGPSNSGSSNLPSLEGVNVTIPFPSGVRSVTEIKTSRGEANFDARTSTLTWKIPTKESGTITGFPTLSGTVSGPIDLQEDGVHLQSPKATALLGYYDEDLAGVVEDESTYSDGTKTTPSNEKRFQANAALMPRSAAISFSVKGWLPSGIKVDSLVVDTKKSKGLGEGVKPFKGVKYMTVSRRGVERRV